MTYGDKMNKISKLIINSVAIVLARYIAKQYVKNLIGSHVFMNAVRYCIDNDVPCNDQTVEQLFGYTERKSDTLLKNIDIN